MNIEEWNFIYKKFDTIQSDFISAYSDINGKNKKIKNDAERKSQGCIQLTKRYIDTYPEVYDLLISENVSGHGGAIIFDDFVQPRYFERNMTNLLSKIREKIKSMEM